jgi:NADH-quinone oxidoreductase subunit M
MGFVTDNILALILFTPILVAIILLFLPKERIKLLRWVTLVGSLVSFVLTLYIWLSFKADTPGFQFETQRIWYGVVSSSFHLGVDGLSLTMVLLTTLLTPIVILASFNITERVKPYMILFMLLETGMLGVFMSLDLLLFFVFWEVFPNQPVGKRER